MPAGFTPRWNYSALGLGPYGTGTGVVAGMVGLPWNADGWDGFQFERQQVLNAMAANSNNVIVNSGDAHTFWATVMSSNSADRARGGVPNMAEWCGGAVTSPGWGDQAAGYASILPGRAIDQSTVPLMNLVEDGFRISDKGLLASRMPKGALVFQVTPTTYTGQMFTVNNIATRAYAPSCDNSFVIPASSPGSATATACVNTIGGVVPGPMVAAPAPSPPPTPSPPLPPPSPSPMPPTPPPPRPPTPPPYPKGKPHPPWPFPPHPPPPLPTPPRPPRPPPPPLPPSPSPSPWPPSPPPPRRAGPPKRKQQGHRS